MSFLQLLFNDFSDTELLEAVEYLEAEHFLDCCLSDAELAADVEQIEMDNFVEESFQEPLSDIECVEVLNSVEDNDLDLWGLDSNSQVLRDVESVEDGDMSGGVSDQELLQDVQIIEQEEYFRRNHGTLGQYQGPQTPLPTFHHSEIVLHSKSRVSCKPNFDFGFLWDDDDSDQSSAVSSAKNSEDDVCFKKP